MSGGRERRGSCVKADVRFCAQWIGVVRGIKAGVDGQTDRLRRR